MAVRLTPADMDEALALALFSERGAGRPVYAMPDEDDLVTVGDHFGISVVDARKLLLRVATLQITGDGGSKPFAGLAEELSGRPANSLETPPGLATIAVLSLAADSMHAAEGMAANNYYGRLHSLLETPDDSKKAIESGYRDHGEELWDALNSWLETWEGERGIPTAYVVGTMRYVGLALSQALVRRADREKFPRVFLDEGLPPGYRMAPSDMEATLDGWIPRNPPYFSHSLRALWMNPSAHERIAGVACLELESWDGSDLRDGYGCTRLPERQARVVVHASSFPRTTVSFDLSLPARETHGRVELSIDTADGPTSLIFRPSTAGTLQLNDPNAIDFSSLLSGELRITGEGESYLRRPRRVVPLRFDELRRAFVEVETAHLGETTFVLAADGLDPKIIALLNKAARRGWSQLAPDTRGMPSGWSAFRDVQILTRAEGSIPLDLQPLLPRASISLVLSGGLALPGLLRKWSSLAPPAVHAISPDADSLLVELSRGPRTGDCLVSESVAGSVAVVELADRGLTDGDYLASVKVNGAASPSATALLRLRSGSSPQVRGPDGSLTYQPRSGGLWPISAVVAAGDQSVDGARVAISDRTRAGSPDPMPPAGPRVPVRAPDQRRPPLLVGLGVGHDSCMRTGKHRMEIPPALPGIPPTRSVEGVCTTCGLIKRYPTNPLAAVARKKRHATKALPTLLDVAQIPEIRTLDATSWEPAFDALCHLRRGTVGSMSRILSQLDGSPLAVDVLLRGLEALGHINVERDTSTLEIVQWEMTPPTLVALPGSRWWLVGGRSSDNLAQLNDLVGYSGGTVGLTTDQQVPHFEVVLEPERLLEVVEALQDDWPIDLACGAALKLAKALPPLSEVAAALPRIPVPGYSSVESWNHSSAAWLPATSIESVGAFRLTLHGRIYVLRDRQDLGDGTVTRANAQLAKHVANLWAGDPLAGFHALSGSVVVPLGADLPGLYGRALALSSGRLPVAVEPARMLQYPQIDANLAAAIHDRLNN